ncbi:MAG: hypothetical protein KatS3mg058_1257 [Roseiflexus sp.]|nr:MAG: hypothetical protein KatS3mg058_1257 [Roseiflexus sp.]
MRPVRDQPYPPPPPNPMMPPSVIARTSKIKKITQSSWALRAEALAEIVKAPPGLPRPERGL